MNPLATIPKDGRCILLWHKVIRIDSTTKAYTFNGDVLTQCFWSHGYWRPWYGNARISVTEIIPDSEVLGWLPLPPEVTQPHQLTTTTTTTTK